MTNWPEFEKHDNYRPWADAEEVALTRDEYNQARDAIAAMQWRPIETAPSGKKILIVYKNSLGNARIIIAKHYSKFAVEASYDTDLDTDYSEETDTYYWPEGWYEQADNWDEYTDIALNQGKPSHWMPLPPQPTGEL